MKGYERIAEDKRLQRRTVQDALAVLRIEAGFTDADRAEFHMFGMRLASGAEVALIDLRYDNPSRENIAIVSLPTCSFFRAVRDGAAHRERLPIALLDGSIVDGGGKVVLSDGMAFRAIEVEPAFLRYEPSDLDWRIVHLTLELMRPIARQWRAISQAFKNDRVHKALSARFLRRGPRDLPW